MCKVNEKTYIYPNGDERLVETVTYCSKSDKKTLCNSYERIPQGPFFVHDSEPSLIHDGFGTPASSAGQPSTPTSTAGVDYRSPGSMPRRRSSGSKRVFDASKLKISFRKGGSKHDSHHSRHASASSSSPMSTDYPSHLRQPSGSTVPPPPLPPVDVPERVPSASTTSPSSAHEGRRRRPRAVVDHDLQPNPPPGSLSGGSSLSGRVSAGSDHPDPPFFEGDRRRAQDVSDQQSRRQRREERARATERSSDSRSAEEDQSASDREAREVALDEQARRDWERVNAREAIRAENAARRAEAERANTNQERRYTMPDREAAANRHRRQSSAAAAGAADNPSLIDQLRRSIHAAEATAEDIDDAETQRRLSTLREQLRAARAAQEPASRSSSGHSDPPSSGFERYHQPPPPPPAAAGPSARSPISPAHRSPPIAYETRLPPYPAYPGASTGYFSDTDSTTHHSFTRREVSARNPMPTVPNPPRRSSSYRRPSSSTGQQRPSPTVYDAGVEVARPGTARGGSSHSNAPWTHDQAAFRRHGELVLERARARATQANRAQEASFRMTDAMFDDDDVDDDEFGGGYGHGYGFPPEEFYRRRF